MRWLVWAALVAAACHEEPIEECGVDDDATATCEQACVRLDEIDCEVGNLEECLQTCAATTAGLDEVVQGRVLACMVAARSCRQIDGCGRACGPDDGPVPFGADSGVVPDGGTE